MIARTYIMILCVCILFIICGVDAARTVKGLYCQDPDTKKLYPVNATWRSETFCGNYTCKLRKINDTQTEYTPITKINITDQLLNKTTDMSTSPSQQNVVTKMYQEEKRPIFKPESMDSLNNLKKASTSKADTENDRYLTETEIKAITDILHTVKKSDLEAIVEIYNLAQDIYKEVDGGTTDNQVKDSNNASKRNDAMDTNKLRDFKSYFYKPLHQSNIEQNLTDMKKEDTKATTTRQYRQPFTYFTGPLSDNDFRKLPYYYPMSNFHRTASYSYNTPYMKPAVSTSRPCTTKPPANYLPWYDGSIIRPYVRPQRPAPARPMLLPYPFSYVHNYNYNSYPASFYYNNYPWAQLSSYNKRGYYPYFGYVPKTPVVNIEPEVIKDVESVEDVKEDNKFDSESTLPDWQTEPLSDTVLEEVKANILQKSKLKPVGKPLKLERVGKVIKLDELTREKRHVITDKKDIEEYEPYLVSTVCEPTTEPGFFRVGNQSAPFPACCPQKIKQ